MHWKLSEISAGKTETTCSTRTERTVTGTFAMDPLICPDELQLHLEFVDVLGLDRSIVAFVAIGTVCGPPSMRSRGLLEVEVCRLHA